MDLTLESALSPGGLVGHSSYLLLVISMLMRRMSLLRTFVILSALMAITYDVLWLRDPVGVFWETLLVLVNVVQLTITWQRTRSARFSGEEEAFAGECFPTLSRSEHRDLLDQGLWISAEPGVVLTTQGVAVDHLIYLAEGPAEVISGERTVAMCEPGAFIGEMTVLQGAPANATVKLATPARYWAVEAGRMRAFAARHPGIRAALGNSFAMNMRDKLVRSNRMLADAGPGLRFRIFGKAKR